jgi:hypothetical protein
MGCCGSNTNLELEDEENNENNINNEGNSKSQYK